MAAPWLDEAAGGGLGHFGWPLQWRDLICPHVVRVGGSLGVGVVGVYVLVGVPVASLFVKIDLRGRNTAVLVRARRVEVER